MTRRKSGEAVQQVALSLAPPQPNQRERVGRRPCPGARNYAREIVKHLAHVTAVSGYSPAVVFDDWLRIVEASLEALPTHLKAVARTGRWAEDTPEAAEAFAQVRARYAEGARSSAHRQVWESFSQAFALLLESAAPGLWHYADFDQGTIMGPDVIGQVYMDFANYDPKWAAQYWTPWNVALLMARMTIPDGARDVHDRLKQALTHPDNVLGAAVLLASLVIPEDDAGAHREWFLTRVIPAAIPFYQSVSFCEPAIGSGVMMLAAASQFPDWAVALNLVVFSGMDSDVTCMRMARTNSMLYGLNGYSLKLAEAVGEATEGRTSSEPPAQVSIPKSPQAALDQAVRIHRRTAPAAGKAAPKFEKLVQLSLRLDGDWDEKGGESDHDDNR